MQESTEHQSALIGRMSQTQQEKVVKDLFSDRVYSFDNSSPLNSFPHNAIVEVRLNSEQIVADGNIVAHPETAEASIYVKSTCSMNRKFSIFLEIIVSGLWVGRF